VRVGYCVCWHYQHFAHAGWWVWRSGLVRHM
jgi:hypothetical protein